MWRIASGSVCPVRSGDWHGNRLWKLPIAIDFPDGRTILFQEIALTESPRGEVIAAAAQPDPLDDDVRAQLANERRRRTLREQRHVVDESQRRASISARCGLVAESPLTPTTSSSPCARARCSARRSCTLNESNDPLVNTTLEPCAAASAMRAASAVGRQHFRRRLRGLAADHSGEGLRFGDGSADHAHDDAGGSIRDSRRFGERHARRGGHRQHGRNGVARAGDVEHLVALRWLECASAECARRSRSNKSIPSAPRVTSSALKPSSASAILLVA